MMSPGMNYVYVPFSSNIEGIAELVWQCTNSNYKVYIMLSNSASIDNIEFAHYICGWICDSYGSLVELNESKLKNRIMFSDSLVLSNKFKFEEAIEKYIQWAISVSEELRYKVFSVTEICNNERRSTDSQEYIDFLSACGKCHRCTKFLAQAEEYGMYDLNL